MGRGQKKRGLISFKKGSAVPLKHGLHGRNQKQKVSCPLIPLQAPNSIAHQVPAPHNHREQLTVTQGNAAHAGGRGGMRKRKNKCHCSLIQGFSYFPHRKKESLGLEHTLQGRGGPDPLQVVGSLWSPASDSSSAISSHLFSMVGPRYTLASLLFCSGDCFHAGRRCTKPAVQPLPPTVLQGNVPPPSV